MSESGITDEKILNLIPDIKKSRIEKFRGDYTKFRGVWNKYLSEKYIGGLKENAVD